MLNGWLIYRKVDARENQTYIDWFIEEAKQQNVHLQLVYRDTLTIGIADGVQQTLIAGHIAVLPDFVVVRTIEPLLQTYFETNGVRAFNSANTAHFANHKALTHLALQQLNIPMVETYFFTKDSLPKNLPLAFPFIMKEATGRGGEQVYLINNRVEWEEKVGLLRTNDGLIQKLNQPMGKDLRVFVIGKKIIAAVLRENKKDFRANYSLGGSAIQYELTQKDIAMIQKIINHFEFDLVGIDFLINESGNLLFNEIEDVVGSRILSEVTEINLLKKYITYIIKNVPLPHKVLS